MRTFTRLQQLNLTDEPWEDILPEPEVLELMTLECKAYRDGCIAHTTLELWVDKQLKFITSEVLLTLCAEAEAVPAACWDYSICQEDETSNPMAGHAMEMLGCGHAFHRKCITKWFGQRSTCPMCRRDLSMYLDPTVQRFLSHFTEEDY
ncbi:putative RING-H2 finger protein ATL37 [Miscanthus floridulus]|uniref:putative RING-H2 finger protein ATL37 n=1 Tax=Miscanthus floridulus TaxID=154761 RepID=UPI0034586C6C